VVKKMNREKVVKILENVIEVFFLLSIFFIPAGPVLKYIFQSALLLVWLVKLIVKKGVEFTSTSLDYPILLFSLIGLASVVISYTSFYQAGKGFSNLLEWFLAFYIAVHLLKRKEQVERMIKVWLGSAVAVICYGLFQLIKNPNSLITSFFTLNSFLAQYLILIIPVVFSLFFFRKTKKEKIFLGIVFLLSWFILISTMERGAWLGIISGLLVMGIILRDKRILIGFPSLLILSLLVSLPFRMQAVSIFWPSYHLERIHCWRSCLSMIKEHPLTGVGLGNFRYFYPKYMLSGAEVKLLHAHNIFFQVAVEMGIPGLLSFLWILFLFFKDAGLSLQQNEYLRTVGAGLSVGIIAILITSFFHDIFHSRQIATLIWYVIGTVTAIKNIRQKAE